LTKLNLMTSCAHVNPQEEQAVAALLIFLAAIFGLAGGTILLNESGILALFAEWIDSAMSYIETFNTPFAIGIVLIVTALIFIIFAIVVKRRP